MLEFTDDLELLLRETPAHAIERERSTFDSLVAPFGGTLVLFGAGDLGRKLLHGLRQIGITPLAFSDNNPQRWNSIESGLPVLSPGEAAAKFGQTAAFIIAVWHAHQKHRTGDIQRQLTSLGCRKVITVNSLFWSFPDIFLPHCNFAQPHRVLANAPAIRHVFQQLKDRQSRIDFLGHVRWRLTGDFQAMADAVEEPQYWPHDVIKFGSHEHFVDCGAFDGDTIRELLSGRHLGFDRITAFEPGPANFQKLSGFVGGLPPDIRQRIHLQPRAVGLNSSTLAFNAETSVSSAVAGRGTHVGPAAKAADQQITVGCVSLDEVLTETPPTFTKMDIEGSEMDALRGARKLIQLHRPVMAVCAYHLPEDLWNIPTFLLSIYGDYRIFFRSYNQEGFDIVCYAVPPNRLVQSS